MTGGTNRATGNAGGGAEEAKEETGVEVETEGAVLEVMEEEVEAEGVGAWARTRWVEMGLGARK